MTQPHQHSAETGARDGATREDVARDQAAALLHGNDEQMKRYVDIVTSVGVARGLLGPREPARIWSRHILNCAALCGLLPQGAEIIDIGSGAGLPGLVVAIARPDLRITLLEPMLRRTTFLGEVVEELGLSGRVTVTRGRAEDCTDAHEIVTARAVARLPRLLAWTAHLIAPGGRLLAFKGDSARDEIDEAAPLLRASGLVADVVPVRAHPDAEATNVVTVARAPRVRRR